MTTKQIMRQLLNDASFSQATKDRCKSLLPLLNNQLDVRGYSRARRRLNDLRHSTSDKRKIELVDCFLFLFKKLHSEAIPSTSYRDPHVMTDHAFCSALRRYFGTDLLSEKDAVLQLADKNGWPYSQKNGKIITFYPSEAA